MMNIMVNDLGFELIGEQFPEGLPRSGNPDGYFECGEDDIELLVVPPGDGRREVAKLWPLTCHRR